MHRTARASAGRRKEEEKGTFYFIEGRRNFGKGDILLY